MKFSLKRHPANPEDSDFQIDAEIIRHSTEIHLHFQVFATPKAIENIAWGSESVEKGSRGSELWKGSCFEFFIAPSNSGRYFEFNFSPRTQWDFFSFTDFRDGSSHALISERDFEIVFKKAAFQPDGFELELSIRPCHGSYLQSLNAAGDFQIQISSILKMKDDRNAFFAIEHPKNAPPDFHSRSHFVQFMDSSFESQRVV